MPCRPPLILALVIGSAGLCSTAIGAPTFTQGGDAAFRHITASGGTLSGVDVTAATVSMNGTNASLGSVAALASQAVPASQANQPNGWLQLDGNGLVPATSIPSTISGVDATARAAAAAAQAIAAAAEPANAANNPGGFPRLDSNGLIQTANLPAAYTASTAIALSSLGTPNGPARLDGAGTLSSNIVSASWSSAVGRNLGDRWSDSINVKDFGAVGDGVHDDTSAIQAAVNTDLTLNLGQQVVVPPGTYLITSTITATISGNAGLDFKAAGSGEVMFLTKFPATATNWDLFEINYGGGGINTPYREPGISGAVGQFLSIGGFTAIQDDAVGQSAGDIVHVVGDISTNYSSTLPNIRIDDVYGQGAKSLGNQTGSDSGYDAWLNGIELDGSIPTATIKNWGLNGPLDDGDTPGASQPLCAPPAGSPANAGSVFTGEQYVPPITYNGTNYSPLGECKVAGAGVLLVAPDGYNQTVGGVTITNGNVKGYMAGVAVSGAVQGTGIHNLNTFNDAWGVLIGGGNILDQRNGPAVVAQASGTSTYGGTAATQTITLSAANSAIKVGMRAEGNYMPYDGIVQAINGTTVTLATANGANFGIGGSFSNENISFTNGKVLTTPSGSGTFGISMACDDWYGCVNDQTDPNTSFAFNNVVLNGINLISNDGSPDWIAFVIGKGVSDQVVNNDLQSGRGMNQQFLVGGPALSTPYLDIENNIIDAGASSQAQISLSGATQAVVSGNHSYGSAPIGSDNGCSGVWGTNYVNSQVQIGVAGCGGLSFDTNQNLSTPGFIAGSFAGGRTPIPGLGTAQSGATQLTAQYNVVSCQGSNTAYLVPSTAEVGDSVDIYNAGQTACLIYPQPGTQMAFDLLLNLPFTLGGGQFQRFTLQSSSTWFRPARNLLSNTLTLTQTLGLGTYSVSNLPSGCLAGQEAYATDALKPGEAAGTGSGVPVICTLSASGGSTQWWSAMSNALVTK